VQARASTIPGFPQLRPKGRHISLTNSTETERLRLESKLIRRVGVTSQCVKPRASGSALTLLHPPVVRLCSARSGVIVPQGCDGGPSVVSGRAPVPWSGGGSGSSGRSEVCQPGTATARSRSTACRARSAQHADRGYLTVHRPESSP